VVAFAYATLHSLRGQNTLGAARERLPDEEAEAVLAAPHTPLAVAAGVSERLAEARDRGAISDFGLGLIDRHVAELIDAVGACERIHKTPLPFVYVVHLRRSLILYCFTLPFALVGLYGWWAVLVTLFVSYTLFGVEEIGVEIENPFGHDANDLPLEQYCETIERDVLSLLGPEAAV
jgi:putative membrane protein